MRLTTLSRTVLFLFAAGLFGAGESPTAYGAFSVTNWSRSGTTQFRTTTSINTAGWSLRMQDTDEMVATGAMLPAFNIPAGGELTIVMNGFNGPGSPMFKVDAASLPGSVITMAPHDLDNGTWAYAMGLYDNLFQPQVFFQIRRAGSMAAAGSASLASSAVLNGLWPSTSAYIEFQPQFAGYGASAPASSPSVYVGFVLPEPTGLGFMAVALLGLASRSRRRSA